MDPEDMDISETIRWAQLHWREVFPPEVVWTDKRGRHFITREEWDRLPRWRRTWQRWSWRVRLYDLPPDAFPRFFWLPMKVDFDEPAEPPPTDAAATA